MRSETISVEGELRLESYQLVRNHQYENREGRFTCFKCGKLDH